MKATLPTQYTANGKRFDKPITCWYHLIVRKKGGELHELVYLEVTHNKNRGANHASFWFFGDGVGQHHAAGHGSAHGYGYHRPSAAAQSAIYSAGFTLSEEVAGIGDSAIRRALVAIAEACGIKETDTLIVGS